MRITIVRPWTTQDWLEISLIAIMYALLLRHIIPTYGLLGGTIH